MASPGIRKAAIFIDSLEPEVADKLLERLPQEYATEVRSTWMALGRINAEEREQVIKEFLQLSLQNKLQPISASPLGRHQKEVPTPPKDEGDSSDRTKERPFQTLREAEIDKLLNILANERPPTIALVLAHLPPPQAGALLVRFPRGVQVDIIRCLLELEETDPDILREVDHALQERLAQLATIQRRRVAGLTAIAGMVGQSSDAIGEKILETVSLVAPEVAERVSPVPVIDFNQFIRFDDTSLGTIFDHAELEVVVLALWGAPLGFTERVLKELPDWKSQAVRAQLADLGPIRLRDVEEARRRLGEIARQLAIRRKIRLPRDIHIEGRGNVSPTTPGADITEGRFVAMID